MRICKVFPKAMNSIFINVNYSRFNLFPIFNSSKMTEIIQACILKIHSVL